MSPLASLENRDAVAEGSVETTVEIKADTTAQVETNSSDSGVINTSTSVIDEPLIETKIESETVEASTSPLESRTDVHESADSLSHTALIQNIQENEVESTVESSSGSVPVEEGVSVSEKMTLEFITLHGVEVQVGSLKADELLQTKSSLDEQIEKQLQELLVQTEPGAEYKAAAETENSSEEESDILTKALSNWDSLSEDLQELEGESGMLVNDLLLDVTAVLSKTPAVGETRLDSEESLQMEEKGGEEEVMTLESITLSDVTAEVEGLESEVLLETKNALDKEAEVLVKEEQVVVEMTTEDVALLEDATEAELLAVDSISEATDALEAETSVLLEAMFGSEQGPRQPLDTLPVKQQDVVIDTEAEKESGEQEESVLEAMTLESVTLAEVEVSLGSLENESLSETTDYLEKEAEIIAGETRMEVEVEDEVVSEEKAEELKIESLSLPEDDALSDLQTDALMEELLFSVPGHMTRERESPIGQEANVSNAAVSTGSVDDDSVAEPTGEVTASPALEEVQQEQEVEEEGAQTETLGKEYDLDPVQRLFLEKIREYNNIRGINGEPLEAEPDYEKHLSQETAKLQRLYGGGDLSSFPEFTFTDGRAERGREEEAS
ncbi:gelsolin-related protein of 125 kDa-like isoform X1 [Sparus aurata]|uniref:gelsolin-related protein of 125 kDa-like isoform X1 n=1 Tax=Sparus aurata TaxID=8175 RepID=UPI0011C10A00|nr:gelsolin-related protein of 125 kDa-like isoform X1 [Sparus aurata]XP_030298783.1 gelsolin-related protein of 125 kDa-like isoform X1 [Sparus aurata]